MILLAIETLTSRNLEFSYPAKLLIGQDPYDIIR